MEIKKNEEKIGHVQNEHENRNFMKKSCTKLRGK